MQRAATAAIGILLAALILVGFLRPLLPVVMLLTVAILVVGLIGLTHRPRSDESARTQDSGRSDEDRDA
jgi:hypothetical protein